MAINLKLTIVFLFSAALLFMACVSDADAPLPTYTPYSISTPYPAPTLEVIIKEVPVEVIKEVVVEKIVEVVVTATPVPTLEVIIKEVPVELIKEIVVEKIMEVVVTATPVPVTIPTSGPLLSPTPIPTPVLDVQLIPSLIENNSHNITNDIWDSNWIWSEQSWDATSTGRISQTLIHHDDSLIAILEASNCIWNLSSNSLGDDCDRSIRRSQIRSHQSFQINTRSMYKFTVSKILAHGNSDAGNYINFFEIKPWTDGITFTVPTMALYVNPHTNQMSVIQSLGNHGADPNTQNDIVEPLGKLLEGWNDFQIHMKHSANSDGYLKIYQNEQVIYDYKGKTSYEHSRPIKYWVGPYICCEKIDSLPNEPNHIFVYKNVIAEGS